MSRSLEYLTQHVLGHSLIQAANVEGPLVRLRRSSSEASGGRDHSTAINARAGGCDGRRDWVVILRNMKRRRGEVSWVALAILGGRDAHRLRSGRDSASVGHCRDCVDSASKIESSARLVGDGGAQGVAAVGGEEEGEEKSVERRGLRGGCNEEIPMTSSLKHGRREKKTKQTEVLPTRSRKMLEINRVDMMQACSCSRSCSWQIRAWESLQRF